MKWQIKAGEKRLAVAPEIPDYERDIHDPFLLKDMDKAVERIFAAVKNNERVTIFGDYDADGVPATALLATVFTWIGFTNFGIYIPDRHNEAFGLSNEAIKKFACPEPGRGGDENTKLIITVDCGITDTEEVKLASDLGIAVIITDHHLPPAELPPAVAVVDPKRADCNYPNKNLCGTGVAYKLAQALLKRGNFSQIKTGQEKSLLDLVALATVADMVAMTDENRALTYFGLIILAMNRRPGLAALARVLRLNPQHITEDDIGFSLGPRINSASRMSHASEAYELLMSQDTTLADKIAKDLEARNTARRSSVDEILDTANKLIEERGEIAGEGVLVVGEPDFSLGVLGLTASRLVEKYKKPVFVWGVNGLGEVKGSCRSDGSINVVNLMAEAGGREYFTDYGGHVMAGGFSLPLGREAELGARLNTAYADLDKDEVERTIFYDQALTLTEVTDELYDRIRQYGPFGPENEKPLFWLTDLRISEVKMFGNGGLHLELKFKDLTGRVIPAIGFFFNKDLVFTLGERVDLLANLERSHFRYRPELRLRIVDIRKVE
ncbi:MAG: single-stranded-DNA-specific exonuclease RecJ [Candidatus Vogelbacteria bacterium GWA1_51_14]|uniref:Single-stranded-DNA-specific exonuclease RecJ n=1 Tax=Candidatus Vogelbacteria bacterium GWA1_51_14 TaxID=1802435 RepID=A0A1G2Q8I4_9BACT|nr:MAG: single-stranded-DNA-specific exonuclease RecJ [Candidatus Vogelbacteria bacterium GWA1_51_14]